MLVSNRVMCIIMHFLRFMQLAYASRKSVTKVVKVSLLPPPRSENRLKGGEIVW